jgi:hypothetical protein
MPCNVVDVPPKMSVNIYQTTWHHIPEDSNLYSHSMRTSHLTTNHLPGMTKIMKTSAQLAWLLLEYKAGGLLT